LNALRDPTTLDSETPNILQPEIVKRMKDRAWVRAMKAKKCYPLDQYAEIVRKALPLFMKKKYDVRVVHVDSVEPAAIERYLADFAKNETSADNFIIANFDQAIFTGESESAGHVSPIAAYDKSGKRFLVLDVDREWYEPYWVPQDAFFRSLATLDPSVKKSRGYLVVEPHVE
jgi:hypothetical protein